MIDPLRWPTAVISRATGRIADVRIPRALRRPVLGGLARALGMDLGEAADPITDFPTLDALFVRSLRDGARAWPTAPGVPGSPVDGVVGQRGRIADGRLLQAKGRDYTAAELLDDRDLAARFDRGTFLTLYLAPRHYHRIHAPVDGVVAQARHVPGRLLPVNAPAVRSVDRLFPRNERLTCVIDPSGGEQVRGPGSGPTPPTTTGNRFDAGTGAAEGARSAVAVVAVGAFNVGRITAAFDDDLVTNRSRARPETRRYDPPVRIERGDDLMAFHLGSTVVLLFERPAALDPALEPGREVRLGQPLVVPGAARTERPD